MLFELSEFSVIIRLWVIVLLTLYDVLMNIYMLGAVLVITYMQLLNS